MAAYIDILEDVNQKFTGTIVMYDKKAMLVKGVSNDPDKAGQFILQLAAPGARELKMINLLDPALNYQNFNIGYCNGGIHAAWWYRKPSKQWSQGLRSNQMGFRISNAGAGPHDSFSFSKHFIRMLEQTYPTMEECKKTLMDENAVNCMAFHQDFGLSYDDLHEDFLLEYHGTRIGTSVDKDLKQFKIKSEARYLIEALQEAQDVHA
jgi:hypothetical protein